MSTQRGRIRITGFDPAAVEERESLSEWVDETEMSTESRWIRAWRNFRRNRSAMLGLAVVVAMSLLTIFARPISIEGVTVQPFAIAPFEPSAILYLKPEYADLGRYHPPDLSQGILMGTDGSGRDMFSRVLFGGRYSISIGFIVVALTASVGIVYGAVSGYYGGWVDELMMRVLDVIFAFPGLVLALVIISVLGGGYWQLVLAFSLFGWAGYARLIRGEILSVKENEYVMAAKALGAKDRSVIFRHIVPNALAPVVVQASLNIGTVVIGVAALGFLGLGFDPGTPEWGTMLDQTRNTLIQGPGGSIPWWATVFPGGAIFLFVMAMNLIGDGINDALDAQQGGSVGRGGGG
jgi:peptide/nickel transport system permease protein